MIRRPPRSTRTDTLFPYTTLFRSHDHAIVDREVIGLARRLRLLLGQDLRHIFADALVGIGIAPIPLVSRDLDRQRVLLGRFILRREQADRRHRSEEHTSELQSLMRISYAVFCLKKKTKDQQLN